MVGKIVYKNMLLRRQVFAYSHSSNTFFLNACLDFEKMRES